MCRPFGKVLSKEYISTLKAGQVPKNKEVISTERKMDALTVKLAEQLESEGCKSIAKLKVGRQPHKTTAIRVGLGFVGKICKSSSICYEVAGTCFACLKY